MSKYHEDVYRNGHTTVWGSFYHKSFGWGYKCCHSFDKNSNCKGERGLKEFYAKEYQEIYGHQPMVIPKPVDSKMDELKRLALEVLGDELSSDSEGEESEQSSISSHKRFKFEE